MALTKPTSSMVNFTAPTIQKFIANPTGATNYAFVCSSANATLGATFTNNGQTFTVLATIAAGLLLFCSGTGTPAASGTLTKSAGTGDSTITFSAFLGAYIPTSSLIKYVRVRGVGGGAGGGGGGDSGTAGSGGAGGNSLFGTSLLAANGGAAGLAGNPPTGGAGGSASLGTGPTGTALSGGSGTGGGLLQATTAAGQNGGGGGSSHFGGAGAGGQWGGAGTAAVANTGGGGGGGGNGSTTTNQRFSGGGGGAGGFVDCLISGSTWITMISAGGASFQIGAAGTAGTAGTAGSAGGAGSLGYWEVTEFYQ